MHEKVEIEYVGQENKETQINQDSKCKESGTGTYTIFSTVYYTCVHYLGHQLPS